VTTTALPDGSQATAYTATLAASGGTPPYSWSIVSGALPAGLALTASTGAIAGTPTATGTATFTAKVTAGAQTATKVLSITIAPPVQSIWPSTTAPVQADGGPDSAVELGVKFRSDVAGYITGIRFYKHAQHGHARREPVVVRGNEAPTATFTNEHVGLAASHVPVAVAITATVYVASYRCPNGHYSADLNYFTTQGVDRPPLHALATGVSGPNGVFAYGASSSFPTGTYFASNYWVDVVFSTTAP
jgi:hypothetical protein